MILATVAVEDSGGNLEIFRFLRDRLADLRRLFHVLAFRRDNGSERLAGSIIDQLRVDTRERAEDREARAHSAADHLGTDSALACLPELDLGWLH